MDRLRSPGGCPWDAQQTHGSLVEFLLEEAHETIAAIETEDTSELIEELGDLLLQVVFHARLGEEEEPSWGMAEVAAGVNAKLIRRHPHVFDNESGHVPNDAELAARWARGKAVEKSRTSALDGIPITLPALAQAQKTWRRAQDAELNLDLTQRNIPISATTQSELGGQLLALTMQAEASGWDAEAALRGAITDMRDAIQTAEKSDSYDESDPGAVKQPRSG
jgi:XTP/dITP diphosphohydrolase